MQYLSRFVSQNMACWLEVSLHRIDTHAYLSADVCWTSDPREQPRRELFFREWVCDRRVLLDWINRGVITRIEQAPRNEEDHLLPHAMREVEETMEGNRPSIPSPLTVQQLWYEAVLDRLSENSAEFELSVWGYKYSLEGLTAPRDAFFILTDRLDARIRLRAHWNALDEALGSVRIRLPHSVTLGRVGPFLEHDLKVHGSLTETGVDQLLRSLFPLFERMLREDAIARGWPTHNLSLDHLIRKLDQANKLANDSKQLASLVAKPYRDVLLHGHCLALPVARVVLVTLLDAFARVARDLDAG